MSDEGESLDEMMAAYRDQLLRRIRWMMGTQARRQAESGDFLQEVFATALQERAKLSGLDPSGRLRWLTAIARNRIRREVGRRQEQALASLSAAVSAGDPAADSSDVPHRQADQNEQVEFVVDALESLKAEYRNAIEWRDFEGLSFRQIGERLGRTENAAQMLHTRAVLRLGEAVRKRSRG